MKATVAERGQITIPKHLREKLGIRPGTVMAFREENGKLVAIKMAGGDPVAQVFGCMGLGLDSDALLAGVRGKA